jgi:hypothetical protein
LHHPLLLEDVSVVVVVQVFDEKQVVVEGRLDELQKPEDVDYFVQAYFFYYLDELQNLDKLLRS